MGKCGASCSSQDNIILECSHLHFGCSVYECERSIRITHVMSRLNRNLSSRQSNNNDTKKIHRYTCRRMCSSTEFRWWFYRTDEKKAFSGAATCVEKFTVKVSYTILYGTQQQLRSGSMEMRKQCSSLAPQKPTSKQEYAGITGQKGWEQFSISDF